VVLNMERGLIRHHKVSLEQRPLGKPEPEISDVDIQASDSQSLHETNIF
jgi:hypothetical protein